MPRFSDNFLEKLASATRVVALTGAGASAESGIPTFRDPGGVWDQVDPAELASMAGFLRAPVRVQAWYSARRAGSSNVIGIHGNLLDSECASCGQVCAPLEVSQDDGEPMSCSCGGLVRPSVVWFGEMLDPALLDAASKASAECEVFLSIGTGAEVQPAAALPLIAANNGAYVIEINPRPTTISSMVSEVVRGRAGDVLPEILRSLVALNSQTSIAVVPVA